MARALVAEGRTLLLCDEAEATINSRRLPVYHRLDLRLEYTPKPGRIAWNHYLDIINAYARTDVEDYQYTADYSRWKPEEGLPFLPSLGVSWPPATVMGVPSVASRGSGQGSSQ